MIYLSPYAYHCTLTAFPPENTQDYFTLPLTLSTPKAKKVITRPPEKIRMPISVTMRNSANLALKVGGQTASRDDCKAYQQHGRDQQKLHPIPGTLIFRWV